MEVSKQKTSVHHEHKRFLSHSYASKEEFVRGYKKLYYRTPKAKKLYLQILVELEKAVSVGNLDSFKNLRSIIGYINDVENQITLKTYCDDTDNPFVNTNLVILACKFNQVETLKYIFNNSKIFDNFSIDTGIDVITPDDEDNTCHNAFYYAIRSSNVELLGTLINNWPCDYFTVHLEELDEILSKAYEELKLKNVPLSDKVEIFVVNKLINLRFFSDDSEQDQNFKVTLSNIKERIQLVLENIRLLNSNVKNVDERFIYIARFVAQNIHVLKRQLKSTYDRLPWEEIEFCLVSFISSHIKQQEINIFYQATLNKGKILKHLENFAKILKDEKDKLENMEINKIGDLPKLKRETVVAEVIGNYPQFEELYNDYQQCRDIHSLQKISNYIKLAILGDPKEREGQLIITRTLQVIGEYLKNTLESPKLSNTTSELLLLSLPRNTREIIIKIRNSLSHAHSLSKRTEIEENADVIFFTGIQNDIKKIDSVITDILYNNKFKMIRLLLKKIINSENAEDIREVAEDLTNVELDQIKSEHSTVMEHEKLEKLIKELNNIITEKTSYEEKMFNKINNIFNLEKTKLANTRTNYMIGILSLKSLNVQLSTIKIDNNIIRGIKFRANKTLENITPKIEPHNIKEIVEFATTIFHSVRSRIKQDRLDEIDRLICDILIIAEYGLSNIKWIEDLREKLNIKVSFKERNQMKTDRETKDKIQLKMKLNELKSILSKNALSNQLTEHITSYKSNKKLQAVIEMLVLDIMSILGTSEDYLTNNFLFLDDNTPLLTGKCLRNHLAHDNALVDVLLFDPTIAVILNAKKLITENIITNKNKFGKLVTDDPFKLKVKFGQGLNIITNQDRLFIALEEGNLESLKCCLEQGADTNAKSINSWTTLHFAAKGPSLDVIKFILEQNSNVSINAKDINDQNPMHVAAAYGRSNIIEFFIKKGLDVSIVDKNGATPLHIAAQNGHKDTVKVLLKNKANIITKNNAGVSPVHCAISNNHTDVVKVLLEKDRNVDINETLGGFTPLHEAAENGYLELVNFLLQSKADVNAKTDRDWTPLHAAAFNGHLEIVKSLITKGAKVNARIIDGCTTLHYAVENGHERIADVLIKHEVNVNVADKTYKNTPLHYAAKDGHEGIVKILLKNKANASVATVEGMTPLHFATQSGHLEIVIALLNQGVDIHAKSINLGTPLHYAAENGHKAVVEILIKNKAKVNATDNNNCTPLYVAAGKGHKDIIDVLIKNNAEVNIQNSEGSTPLHEAAINGSKDVIELLIKYKSDVNARTYDGLTPLHLATNSGCIGAIDFLIKNKADVNAKANYGLIPLHGAVVNGHTDVVNLLIKNNAEVGPDSMLLHVAVKAGHKDVIKILIANGANINEKGKSNMTPLSSAVKHNYKEIVEVLLEKGANVNIEGVDPLSLAISAGYMDIVKILLKHQPSIIKYDGNKNLLHLAAAIGHNGIVNALITKGADVNAKSINNVTPLYIAAEAGYEEVVEVLILNGANVNAVNNEAIPVHIAASYGHNNVVEVLLNNGANINIKDNKNRTPVELAIARDHFQVVRTLLQHKEVDMNATGNDDWTMLHIAAQAGNLKIIAYLVDKGANINARNASGSKPIHIAAREGYKNIVEFFLTKGLRINDIGAADQTLLHYSALVGQVQVAEYLIERGTDVNSKDANGSTPIHTAASNGCKDVIEVLLKNGAIYNITDNLNKKPLKMSNNEDIINLFVSTEKLFEAVKQNNSSEVKNYIEAGAFVNAKNTDSGTPLHYAAWKGYDEVVEVLLQYKGNPNVVGKKGLTPLHYATKFSHLKVVKVLLSNGAIYNAVSDNGKTPIDFAVDKNIANLFKLITESFKNVNNGRSKVINDLNKIRDIGTVKAVMNARNIENKSLIVTAINNNFPKIEQLKQIFQDDVSALIDKGNELFAQEKYGEALNVFRRVLEKRREILGSDNPGTLDIQGKMATILYKQQNYQEALNLFEINYQKQKEILGINNKDTLITRSTIALVLHRQGKNQEALKLYEEIYEKQKNILEPYDLDILNTQAHMALVLETLCKHEEALSVNYEVFEKRKKILGISHPATLSTQNNIAMVLNNQGKHEEALKAYKMVYETRRIILGANHSDTLRTLHNMVGVLCMQQKYDEAVYAFKEVLDIQKANLGPTHLDTLNTQNNMANVLLKQGKFVSALKNYKESMDQRKAILGPNHPDVLQTLEHIKVINFRFKLEGSDITNILQNLQKDINIAANNGDIDNIQYLLKHGADINDNDTDGRTPLHYAINNGHIHVVKFLLKNGADATQITNKGNTPLHTAISKGYKEIVEILLQHVNRDKLNNFINAKTIVRGATSLHVAAKNGSLDIVKSLLRYGATYNIENKEGKTPLNLSNDPNISHLLKLTEEIFEGAKKGNVEVISKLRSLKPDELAAVTNTRNNQGNTLLQVAITNKHKTIISELLKMLK